MIHDWQNYVLENIDMSKPVSERGFVKNDNLDNFVSQSVYLTMMIDSDTKWRIKDANILDIGCGTGRLPIGIDVLGINIESYIGIDINKAGIEFLKNAFISSERHTFIHSEQGNAWYAPKQSGNTILIPDKKYDLVVAWSVFTHQGTLENASRLLSQIVEQTEDTMYHFTWYRKNAYLGLSDNEAMSVYSESDILQLYKNNNLTIVETFGGKKGKGDQWRIIARGI